MARTEANLHCSMFDPESSLMQCSGPAVLLYVALLARQDINLCGVVKYQPASLAARVPGFDAELVELALDELEQSEHIFVDREVGEIMVATFMHYDRVLSAGQIVKAAAVQYGSIDSTRLRQAVREALPPALREQWPRGVKAMSRDEVQELIKGSSAGTFIPSFSREVTGPSTPSSTPATTGGFRGPARGAVTNWWQVAGGGGRSTGFVSTAFNPPAPHGSEAL